MKIHVKAYFRFWGWTIADRIPCEIPGCGLMSVDIMHIIPKQRGGNNDAVEFIENYMAADRKHHSKYEGRSKDELLALNALKFLIERPNHIWTDKFRATAFFKNHIEPFPDKEELITHLNSIKLIG
jgi:hypothetical protein